jgi:hypothetical protein
MNPAWEPKQSRCGQPAGTPPMETPLPLLAQSPLLLGDMVSLQELCTSIARSAWRLPGPSLPQYHLLYVRGWRSSLALQSRSGLGLESARLSSCPQAQWPVPAQSCGFQDASTCPPGPVWLTPAPKAPPALRADTILSIAITKYQRLGTCEGKRFGDWTSKISRLHGFGPWWQPHGGWHHNRRGVWEEQVTAPGRKLEGWKGPALLFCNNPLLWELTGAPPELY